MLSSYMKQLLQRVEDNLLGCCDAQMIDCPVVQAAEPFLNMAGEDLRKRIFLTQDVVGELLCLRPEFTIPVCRMYIEQGQQTSKRYAYLGQVFRQRQNGITEFYQAGIEDLGNHNIAVADAQAIKDAAQLVDNCSDHLKTRIIIGDQAIFASVIAALGLPEGWQERLLHAFGNRQSLEMMLTTLATPNETTGFDDVICDIIENKDHEVLIRHVMDVMQEIGYSTHASRSPGDIAARMIEKHRFSKAFLGEKELETLHEFLMINVPLGEAVDVLKKFAFKSGLDIARTLAFFSQRITALKEIKTDLGRIHYMSAFGRPLDYYTGLVFEISNADNSDVLAAGGRYDLLMELLGAGRLIPSVGFSLWLDRFRVNSEPLNLEHPERIT